MGPCRAILLFLLFCGDIVCCPAATAQPALGAEGPSLPDVDDVVGAYLKARTWVTAFDAPRSEDDASRIPLRGAGGAAVVLRHKGRVVGSGSDVTADEFMLRRAIGRAMTKALGDPVIAGLDPALRGTIGSSSTSPASSCPCPGARSRRSPDASTRRSTAWPFAAAASGHQPFRRR